MKRPLVLHIGLSKTGSSSIQHVLAENRPALRAQGIYLPTSPGKANHALLAAAFVQDSRMLWGYHPGTWEGVSPEARLERFREEFLAEMAAIPQDIRRVIITAEQLGMLLRKPQEVAALAAHLRQLFDPVTVVVYLRRQDQHAASAYSEWLRGGMLLEPALPDGGPETRLEYDYGGLLDRWSDAFGADALVPRIFARETLADGDVVEDFCRVAEIALPALTDGNMRQSNPSLSLAGQRLLLLAGRRMEERAPGTLWRDTPIWRRLAMSISDAMPGKGWKPEAEEARQFMARFADTNERVRRLFFSEAASLFPEDPPSAAQAPSDSTDAGLAVSALDLLMHEIEVATQREATAAMVQFRLHRQLKNRVEMRTCLTKVIRLTPDFLPARLRLAEVFIDDSAWVQAEEHVAAALRISPNDTQANRLNRVLKKAALA